MASGVIGTSSLLLAAAGDTVSGAGTCWVTTGGGTHGGDGFDGGVSFALVRMVAAAGTACARASAANGKSTTHDWVNASHASCGVDNCKSILQTAPRVTRSALSRCACKTRTDLLEGSWSRGGP